MSLDAYVGEHDPQQRGELITAARLARLGDDLNRQNTRISVPQQIMRVTARPGIGSKVQRFKFASYHGDYIIAKDGTKVAVPYAARTIQSDDNIAYFYDGQTRQAVNTDDPSLTDIEHQVLRRQYKDGRELLAVPFDAGVFRIDGNDVEIRWIELSGRKWVPVPDGGTQYFRWTGGTVSDPLGISRDIVALVCKPHDHPDTTENPAPKTNVALPYDFRVPTWSNQRIAGFGSRFMQAHPDHPSNADDDHWQYRVARTSQNNFNDQELQKIVALYRIDDPILAIPCDTMIPGITWQQTEANHSWAKENEE